MKRWIAYTNRFLAACLMLVLPGGCTDESLVKSGNRTGKTVMVSLQVSLPPAVDPVAGMKQAAQVSRSGQSGQSAQTQQDGKGGAAFTAYLEQTQPETGTKASGGTTELHNLWLFQFNADGSINGDPQQLSDATAAVNDRATLEVPLVVATGQTLYLLVLGPKLEHDFSSVRTLDELEKSSFEYLTSEGGSDKSLVTSDADVPFAGKVTGVTVSDIDSGQHGLVDYNTPDGFTGAIEIRRLMARITLHYKFEVENYRLQGLKLLNVSKTIRLTNPDKNTEDADDYGALESVLEGEEADADGFRTQTWYVAQNRRGTVAGIVTEDKRYYKVDGSTVSGSAPPLGTQIEAWAYSTGGSDKYAIYQMYVGNNNTDNFDVESNHFYNLRTSINAEIESAKNDERIRAYTAEQSINFRASAIVSGTAGPYDKPDTKFKYDLDAHCDTRPINIKAHGRTITVGVYTDEAATMLASPANSWLRLSSSSNYTDAYNNTKEPLNTSVTTKTILPTEVKLYLYSDEYLYPDDGTLPDTGAAGLDNKRSLYVKITTATEGEEGAVTSEATTIYRMDQRPAIYCGPFGGEKKDGVYTKGLLCEQIKESSIQYSENKAQQKKSIYPGYYNVNTFTSGYGTNDLDNGKTATRKLSENSNNLTMNNGISTYVPALQKDASGHVLLYQYQYGYTFAARSCYDLNRDENGNGIIDEDELIWYLPATNQLIGIYVGNYVDNVSSIVGVSTTERSGTNPSNFTQLYSNTITGQSKSASTGRTCVRDIPVRGGSQQVEIYTDARSNKYAAINLKDMPRNVEDRNSNDNFYATVKLYTDESTPAVGPDGNDVYVNRIVRHYVSSSSIQDPDKSLSRRFLLSPDCVNKDGTTSGSVYTMTWAEANGYQNTANSQRVDKTPPSASAAMTGCSAYRGKDGQDEKGTWRVPTHREGAIIIAFQKELEATVSETGFGGFSKSATTPTKYWLATEFYSSTTAFYMSFATVATDNSLDSYNTPKSNMCYLRCIRDVEVE